MDTQDQAILTERQAAFAARAEPKVGDFVRFPDGTMRRISYVLQGGWIQTSKGGSFYLGSNYMSFSGSLYSPIPGDKFTRTNETKEGPAWFFHHNYAERDNGIQVTVVCPVWECSAPPTTC